MQPTSETSNTYSLTKVTRNQSQQSKRSNKAKSQKKSSNHPKKEKLEDIDVAFSTQNDSLQVTVFPQHEIKDNLLKQLTKERAIFEKFCSQIPNHQNNDYSFLFDPKYESNFVSCVKQVNTQDYSL